MAITTIRSSLLGGAASEDIPDGPAPLHPFASAAELMTCCETTGLHVSGVMLANESVYRDEAATRSRLDRVWAAMQACVERGCSGEGVLPGGLQVKRRATAICEQLLNSPESSLADPLTILDWVNLYALAVNEENAAGGRVVTAPINGAAGIIPAMLHYTVRFRHSPHPEGVHRLLLTSAAGCSLYKHHASISGAEAACQGEVGVACSVAAAGLTCDAIGGLV